MTVVVVSVDLQGPVACQEEYQRIKDIAVVALPADLTPVVIKSGDAISITTLPLGLGKIAPVHYLRLTRIDLAPAPTQ